jgi:hypothetical protein
MATLLTFSTKGVPLTVIYPAVNHSGQSRVVRFRLGKKLVLPAYTDASLPHMVQFEIGEQIVTFMINDLLETSYWRRIRNAYDLFGQLEIDEDAKVGIEELERVIRWLRDQSIAWGIAPAVAA